MKIVETNEKDNFELYQTHYYKTSYDKLKETCLQFFEKNQFRLISIDDNYREIYAEIPHFSIQAKMIEQTPLETSIDFYIVSEFLFNNKKKINQTLLEIYAFLSKNFEFKGLGLHK